MRPLSERVGQTFLSAKECICYGRQECLPHERAGRTIALTLLVVFVASASVIAAEPTLVDLDRDPLLMRAVYERLVSHPDHHVRYADSGAASSNVDWEQKTADKWFIEGQRYGGDLVVAGLLCGDEKIAALGWKILDWGFQRQAADGGFSDTGDPFHSVSFFVEASARAVLVAQQLQVPDANDITRRYGPKIAAAVKWMRRREVIGRGVANNKPYAHRRWLVAAAWGMTARLTNDAELATAADEMARDGLAVQRADGVNPEKNGFDVSYQAAGLMFAARYYTVCDDGELRKSILAMLERGLTYEVTKIDDAGQIDARGSTRVNTETGRSGASKTVDNKAVLLALVYGAELLRRDDLHAVAERVAKHLRWIKD
jgi:hypothetical protein